MYASLTVSSPCRATSFSRSAPPEVADRRIGTLCCLSNPKTFVSMAVRGSLSLLERISQWTGDLKLIERFECLSPDFLSGEGPARRYEAARNGWGSGHSPNTAVWVTSPLSSRHTWS